MFNISPSQQFLMGRGITQASGMPTNNNFTNFLSAMGPILHKPQGQPIAPQSAPGVIPPPSGNTSPGIMNRFRSMVANRLPPQMGTNAANNMMPPQQY